MKTLLFIILFLNVPAFAKTNSDILGVSPSASESDIKTAYRKLAKQYHPDLRSGDTDDQKKQSAEKFREINEAYEILMNKQPQAEDLRQPVKRPEHTVDGVQREIERLSRADSDEEMINCFSRMKTMGYLVYQNANLLDAFSKALLNAIESREAVYNPDVITHFVEMFEAWDSEYHFYNEGKMDTPGFFGEPLVALIRKALRGDVSIGSIIQDFKRVGISFSSPYYSNILYDPLFEEKKIANYAEYSEASHIIDEFFSNHQYGFGGALVHYFDQALPFVPAMSAEERLQLAVKVYGNPLKNLAMIQAVLKAQVKDHKMSDKQLSNFIKQAAFFPLGYSRSILDSKDYRLDEFVSFHQGSDLSTLNSLANKFKAKDDAQWKDYPHNKAAWPRGKVAADIYIHDVIMLISRYLGVSTDINWGDVAKELGMNSVTLRARVLANKLNFPSWVSWPDILVQQTQKFNQVKSKLPVGLPYQASDRYSSKILCSDLLE